MHESMSAATEESALAQASETETAPPDEACARAAKTRQIALASNTSRSNHSTNSPTKSRAGENGSGISRQTIRLIDADSAALNGPSSTTPSSSTQSSLAPPRRLSATTSPRIPTLESFPQSIARPVARSVAPASPPSPAIASIFRSVSSASTLQHPTPSNRSRKSSCASSVAAVLEATAEEFTLTSNIDDAIREEFDRLKRSDSRRSSFLSAGVLSRGSSSASTQRRLHSASNILDLNTGARSGGFSPTGYIMSPTQSSFEGGLRSVTGMSPSRASSTRSNRPQTAEGEGFPTMMRSGTGRSSRRGTQDALSPRSDHAALAGIEEAEPSMSSAIAQSQNGDEHDGNTEAPSAQIASTLTASPTTTSEEPKLLTVRNETASEQSSGESKETTLDEKIRAVIASAKKPPTAASETELTRQLSKAATASLHENGAFDDFDGVHCDPDTVAEQFPVRQATQSPLPSANTARRKTPLASRERPKSYFDANTGQQMLYYPAKVPAMLNLPPKLSKGVKSAQHAVRRSQVLSQMPNLPQNRRTMMSEVQTSNMSSTSLAVPSRDSFGAQSDQSGGVAVSPSPSGLSGSNSDAFSAQLRRPVKIGGGSSSMSSKGKAEIPDQLRATAFFDLPSASPRIEMKNGSASAALDEILDAAATAPVNAFTDHVFAGHLGAEVYGQELKPKKRQSKLALQNPGASRSTMTLATADKRRSVWSLLPGKMRPKSSSNLLADAERDARSGRSSSVRQTDSADDSDADESSRLAPDGDEIDSSDDADENDANGANVYAGAPTTLLAELQLRKQEQKRRTMPAHKAFPGGMHSTLLEMDAVAQVEAQTRRGNKVALAWDAEPADLLDQDDEDMPLALLATRKQATAGTTDLSFGGADTFRPPGLMEQRDMEDNEPLSRRRNRLQGREPPTAGPYLMTGASTTRMSMLPPLTTRLPENQSAAAEVQPAPVIIQEQPAERDMEGETLGQRVHRLRLAAEKEGDLPTTRPVSRAFSDELLSQFGPTGETAAEAKKSSEHLPSASGKQTPAIEEEETLGQRRQRLKAEKEARDREILLAGGIRQVSNDSTGSRPALTVRRKSSLGDVLTAHPLDTAQGSIDPRIRKEEERLRKEQEERRLAHEKNARMAAFRSTVPTALRDPSGGVLKPGGFFGGHFNDGGAGSRTSSYGSVYSPPAMSYGQGMMLPLQQQYFASQQMPLGYHGVPMYGQMGMGVGMSPVQMQTPTQGVGYQQMPYGNGMHPQMGVDMMPMGMATPQTQDAGRVETWRRGLR